MDQETRLKNIKVLRGELADALEEKRKVDERHGSLMAEIDAHIEAKYGELAGGTKKAVENADEVLRILQEELYIALCGYYDETGEKSPATAVGVRVVKNIADPITAYDMALGENWFDILKITDVKHPDLVKVAAVMVPESVSITTKTAFIKKVDRAEFPEDVYQSVIDEDLVLVVDKDLSDFQTSD